MAYRYEEQVSVHPIVKIAYLAMLVVFVVTLADPGEPRVLLVLLPIGAMLIAIPLLFGRLVFEVEEETIRIRFGYVGVAEASRTARGCRKHRGRYLSTDS